MGVAVKKSPELVFELGEFFLAWVTGVPFDVVVQDVNRFWFKQLAQFSILVNEVSEPHFFDVWINALVSEPGIKHGQWEKCQDLEPSREFIKLVEKERKGCIKKMIHGSTYNWKLS